MDWEKTIEDNKMDLDTPEHSMDWEKTIEDDKMDLDEPECLMDWESSETCGDPMECDDPISFSPTNEMMQASPASSTAAAPTVNTTVATKVAITGRGKKMQRGESLDSFGSSSSNMNFAPRIPFSLLIHQ